MAARMETTTYLWSDAWSAPLGTSGFRRTCSLLAAVRLRLGAGRALVLARLCHSQAQALRKAGSCNLEAARLPEDLCSIRHTFRDL